MTSRLRTEPRASASCVGSVTVILNASTWGVLGAPFKSPRARIPHQNRIRRWAKHVPDQKTVVRIYCVPLAKAMRITQLEETFGSARNDASSCERDLHRM